MFQLKVMVRGKVLRRSASVLRRTNDGVYIRTTRAVLAHGGFCPQSLALRL